MVMVYGFTVISYLGFWRIKRTALITLYRRGGAGIPSHRVAGTYSRQHVRRKSDKKHRRGQPPTRAIASCVSCVPSPNRSGVGLLRSARHVARVSRSGRGLSMVPWRPLSCGLGPCGAGSRAQGSQGARHVARGWRLPWHPEGSQSTDVLTFTPLIRSTMEKIIRSTDVASEFMRRVRIPPPWPWRISKLSTLDATAAGLRTFSWCRALTTNVQLALGKVLARP